MIIDDKIRDEKLQHNINKEVAKISALSSEKIDKYEYLTLPPATSIPPAAMFFKDQVCTCFPRQSFSEQEIKHSRDRDNRLKK